MGIIKKQSISGSIYSYIGVGLGFIISGILFPNLLSKDEIGLLRILVSYSTLLAQFAVLGFNTVTIKLFPNFRSTEKKHHGFLGLALLISLIGFIITVAIYLGLHHYIVNNAKDKSALFIPYYYYVIPLLFFTLLFGIFDTYYRVLYNAVKGIIYKEVVQRILIVISILLYYFKLISFNSLVIFYSVAIISPAIFLLFALIKDKVFFIKPSLSFIDKKFAKKMASIALFGIIASYSGVLVQNIDLIMVDHYLGLSNAGIYTITFFFGTLILVPLRTMGKISSVVIADAWKTNDLKTIMDIYQKSSLSLSVAGLLLLIGIWGNIDNIFKIIGADYESGKYVILFIALANITDVFLGVSPHIIVNSPHYRWLSFLLIFFTILVIVTNYIFIPMYGIIGAALASLISKVAYNMAKYLFLYWKWRFQPFTVKHLYLIAISIFTWYLSELIPPFNHFIIDIIIRSAIITLLFTTSVYYLKISNDINTSINKIYHRLSGH